MSIAPSMLSLKRRLKVKRKKDIKYDKGEENEKVWINFQITKKLKREFTLYCKVNKINASAFVRSQIEKALENAKKLDNADG